MNLDKIIEAIWGDLGSIEKGMIILTFLIYIVSAFYNPVSREKTIKSMEIGSKSLVRISLLLLSGVFLGSFVGTFLPRSLISNLLGKESGFTGILLGSFFGAIMPGGPYVLFPIVASLFSSGAATSPLMAMIFAWQCISVTRIPTDLGYLAVVEAQKLVWLRILIGIPIPILVGVLVAFFQNSK